ncbi:hypothetical protein ACJ73_08286 [Blastomyces percursus]|uniref:DNA 3'-5' helicase n=1 Tax=Blastomyces percursus TaxID=1658174 RepID=A0A1J9PVQ2_9EURO|nr:hypothetical protein ACJ73_08286 [Blastomyces percursus]
MLDRMVSTGNRMLLSIVFNEYFMARIRILSVLFSHASNKSLSDQQTSDIARFPGTNPCLLSAENLQGQEHLLQQQALSKQFQHVLQDPTLQEKIGLVAINECHLVAQWSEFRHQFARLRHLRLVYIQFHVVHQAVQFFQSELLQLCQNNRQSTDEINLSVINSTIQPFHSRVSEVDKDIRFEESMKPNSKIRIMVATTSLGMGINIPDVERTVVWQLPIEGGDIADVWQRCGRGGRGPGRKSHALILLPYWAFDSEGYEKKLFKILNHQRNKDLSKDRDIKPVSYPSL